MLKQEAPHFLQGPLKQSRDIWLNCTQNVMISSALIQRATTPAELYANNLSYIFMQCNFSWISVQDFGFEGLLLQKTNVVWELSYFTQSSYGRRRWEMSVAV